MDQGRSPDTTWVFERFISFQIKVILDDQPLQVREGCLPEWLRSKKRCTLLTHLTTSSVFRCLAVHRGAHKQHNLPKTRELAKEFFSIYEIPNETVEMEHLPLVASYFRQDIAVFGVSDECVFTLWAHFRPEFAEERRNPNQ